MRHSCKPKQTNSTDGFTEKRKHMKSLIKSITLGALLGVAASVRADTTNLFPNGNFSTAGPTADWVEVSGFGTFIFSYPTTGGNPGGYGVINNSAPPDFYGIWVNGDTTPLTLASLGLNAGQNYTFVQDMKLVSGTDIGGIKIESWGPGGVISDSGDLRPSLAGHNTANWETYSFSYTIAAGATGIKVVPLWGKLSEVAYDNIGVVIVTTSPLMASITSPANSAIVFTNFTINANASVLPGSVTNVAFYDGAVLLGNDPTAPFSFAATGISVGCHALKVVAKSSTGGSVTSSVVTVNAFDNPNVFTVDPSKTWNGFMNVYETPQNGSGFVFGSGWGTGDLRASYAGSLLTLSPNTIGDPNGFWYINTGNGSVGNKFMDANFYVEPAGSLPGVTVTFTGSVLANALTGLSNTNPAGNGWTCVAFIKDFAPDFSSFNSSTTTLTNGTTFSISLATVNDPARHVQYGFETVGPCVWATDTSLAGYGNVQVGPLACAPMSVAITPSLSGGNLNLAFPTETGFTYTVQYKANLTDISWSTLTTTNGTGATAVVTSAVITANRFYRLQIQ
jgi:hypothetical protein